MKNGDLRPAPLSDGRLNIVTGAFGFSGRYITKRLLANGERVRTLTSHPRGHPTIEVAPLDFTKPDQLVHAMTGASVLYNTYWVRFEHGKVNHEKAVENTKLLVRAAEMAGVQRIVHISVTNPSAESSLSYFKGKAAVEDAIRSSSLSHAMLRPALVFGNEDILINNIAWLLRSFPLFAIPGRGEYGLQPIFVEDLAALASDSGNSRENFVVDAIGPETYSYEELVRLIRRTIGSRSWIVHVPASWVTSASWFVGRLVDDIILTRDEISGLTANLLISKQPPVGKTSLRAWITDHAQTIGVKYASELDRHYR